jgi:hypothetical protein
MTAMNEANRIARESLDQTLETGAEAVRGVQEGLTSALENVRDLNVRLIEMAQRTRMPLSTLLAESRKPKRRRIWSRLAQRMRPNSWTC